MTSASITHDLYFAHPPERVWRALTDREAIARWLMPNDFEPRVGHHFTFQTTPMPALNFDGVCHAEVTACEPPRLLAYTWVGGALHTLVTYCLEPEGDGTRIRQVIATRGFVSAVFGRLFSAGSYEGSFRGELEKFRRLVESGW